jgi:Uma2 family endonuclease
MRYLEEQQQEAIVTGESGGYQIGDERYAPDVAYLSTERQSKATRKGYNPLAPDLAVEVESNTTGESERRLRAKIFNYLAAGTVVWVVYAATKEIEVYVPGEAMRRLTVEDVLDGGQLLPGFSVAVKAVFPE